MNKIWRLVLARIAKLGKQPTELLINSMKPFSTQNRMPLPYSAILPLVRRTGERLSIYRAGDCDDIIECWRMRDGRELLIETICAGSVCQLWKPLPLVSAADLWRELIQG